MGAELAAGGQDPEFRAWSRRCAGSRPLPDRLRLQNRLTGGIQFRPADHHQIRRGKLATPVVAAGHVLHQGQWRHEIGQGRPEEGQQRSVAGEEAVVEDGQLTGFMPRCHQVLAAL